LVPEKATAEQAHALLEEVTDPAQVYAVHMLLIRHGREICKAQRPRCPACPALDLCPYPAKTPPADVV
jgi:endonuclease-3